MKSHTTASLIRPFKLHAIPTLAGYSSSPLVVLCGELTINQVSEPSRLEGFLFPFTWQTVSLISEGPNQIFCRIVTVLPKTTCTSERFITVGQQVEISQSKDTKVKKR